MTTPNGPLAVVLDELVEVGKKLVETSEVCLASLRESEAECRPSQDDSMPTTPLLITREETIALLRVGDRTFARLRADPGQKFPAPVRGRPLRWRRREVEQWLEGRRTR